MDWQGGRNEYAGGMRPKALTPGEVDRRLREMAELELQIEERQGRMLRALNRVKATGGEQLEPLRAERVRLEGELLAECQTAGRGFSRAHVAARPGGTRRGNCRWGKMERAKAAGCLRRWRGMWCAANRVLPQLLLPRSPVTYLTASTRSKGRAARGRNRDSSCHAGHAAAQSPLKPCYVVL